MTTPDRDTATRQQEVGGREALGVEEEPKWRYTHRDTPQKVLEFANHGTPLTYGALVVACCSPGKFHIWYKEA
jgi:hypothetical protein